MQIKFKGPRPFVLMLKEPEFFLKSIGQGESLEVSDLVGAEIIKRYPFDFEKVESSSRKRKVIED